MELYYNIFERLEDKITDLFVELQEENGIDCGDCEPMDEFELTGAEEELAEIIAKIIRKQMR